MSRRKPAARESRLASRARLAPLPPGHVERQFVRVEWENPVLLQWGRFFLVRGWGRTRSAGMPFQYQRQVGAQRAGILVGQARWASAAHGPPLAVDVDDVARTPASTASEFAVRW